MRIITHNLKCPHSKALEPDCLFRPFDPPSYCDTVSQHGGKKVARPFKVLNDKSDMANALNCHLVRLLMSCLPMQLTVNGRSADLFLIGLLCLPFYHFLPLLSINLLILFRVFHIIPCQGSR